MPASAEHLLSVHNLRTYFYTFEGVARAVDGASFFLNKGEALGIVGESGCGKSVTASSIMRIVPEPPGRIVGGQILFQGEDLVKLSQKQMRKIRGQRIAMIFQEPMTSLNPVFTIGDQISEMFILHRKNKPDAPWTRRRDAGKGSDSSSRTAH
jgi:ABC-type dipeptide/oligopeptide/nickel transport system ATPase component